MTTKPQHDLALPSALAGGTPKEADHYLLRVLWMEPDVLLSDIEVLRWKAVLTQRGDEFARHAICCYYWLREFASGIHPGAHR